MVSTSWSAITPRFTANGEAIVYRIQIGSYPDDASAQAAVQKLQSQGYSPINVVSEDTFKNVQIGSYADTNSANIAMILVRESGYYESKVVEVMVGSSGLSEQGITYQPSIYEQTIAGAASPVSSFNESQLIQLANLTYSTGSTYSTIRYLTQLIAQYPTSSYIANAKYQLGKIYYSRYFYRYANNSSQNEQWEYLRSATQVLQDVITNYSKDSVAPLAQLELAYCKNALRRFGINENQKLDDAIKEYQKTVPLINKTGDTNLSAKTQMLTASYIWEQALANQASWDTVRTELAKVKANYPQADSWILARCQLMKAESYYFQKNYDQANIELSKLS